MNLFKKKEKKTYKYTIEFRNGKTAKGEIKAYNYRDIYAALMRKYLTITDYGKKAFYWNSDEFLTVEIYEED